jgi:hypothetical protein
MFNGSARLKDIKGRTSHAERRQGNGAAPTLTTLLAAVASNAAAFSMLCGVI